MSYIQIVPSTDYRAQNMQDELQRYYAKDPSWGGYDPNPDGGIDGCDLPDGGVLMDIRDGIPRGMCAFRIRGNTAFTGRLYVRPMYRRQHVARGLLLWQEGFLLGRGIREVRMETEQANRATIELRLSMGFEPVEPYGFYAENPTSVFLGKTLGVREIQNEGCER